MSEYIVDFGGSMAMLARIIESQSANLREEIVRCRDCAYFATDKLGDYCTLFDFEDVKSMGDRFCAWACRKEVDA